MGQSGSLVNSNVPPEISHDISQALIGKSLCLDTKSTETLGLIPVLYKTLDVVLSQVKNFQTVSFRLLQFYSVSSWSCPDMDFLFSNIIKLKFNHFLH